MLVEDVDAWKKIVRQGHGYIYNDFGTQFPSNAPPWNTRDFNKLHRAACSQVKRMTHVSEGKLTKYFFESKGEAVDWLKKNRKDEGYTLCSHCNP